MDRFFLRANANVSIGRILGICDSMEHFRKDETCYAAIREAIQHIGLYLAECESALNYKEGD